MIYLSVKAIHIVAVIFWLGSLLLVALITSSTRLDAGQIRIATRVTEASIGFTWLTGLVLVVTGSWYLSTWWQIKVILVVLISAIHTVAHRRWKASASEGVQTRSFFPALLFFLVLPVVGLAVFKRPI